MFKRLILIVLFSIFLIQPVHAATTVTVQGNTVMITAIDATDWSWITDFPQSVNGLYIWSISFSPSIQGDKCTFRLGSATGNVILHWEADNIYDEATLYFPPHIPFKLYFDSDDPGDTAIVTIILR